MQSNSQKTCLSKIKTKYIYIFLGGKKALKNSLLSHYSIRYVKGSSDRKLYDTKEKLVSKGKNEEVEFR